MITYLIFSFFFENIFNLLFNLHYIIPLFFLISLLIYYQVKKPDYIKYLVSLIALGFIYDMVYTDVYINALLFFVIGCLEILYDKYINNNFLENVIFTIIILIIYELLYYLIYIMLGLNNFNGIVYLKQIIYVIPINIVYYLLSRYILGKFRRWFMPELPEVETVRRSLKKELLGKKICSYEVIYPKIIINDLADFKKIINQEIVDIKRRGKWLIFD